MNSMENPIPYQFEKIYIDSDVEGDPRAMFLLEKLSHIPVERVGDKKTLIRWALDLPDPLDNGKKNLFLTRFKGRKVKPCPGTTGHICCGYYVINMITNCPMDCSYCVLQDYLNNPLLTLYTNWEDLIPEIESFLLDHPCGLRRLGTGELSDSLALDPIFPLSEFLVPYFANKNNAVLELKTKSSSIDRLLNLDHRERTIVSWSILPSPLIKQEERFTASLEERLDAALKCQQKGYLLGFHFDPIFEFQGWEKLYEETISAIFYRIDPKRVAWISLGGFRYPKQLRTVASERFPGTKIFLGEMFPGKDEKFRYLRAIRVEIYRKMLSLLREIDPNLFVYLCMESRDVWQEAYGWSPEGSNHLNHLFDQRLKNLQKIS